MTIEEKQFTQFYLENFNTAYKFILREIENTYTAEDLVQNAYLSALEKGIISNHKQPKAWLYTALRYNILNYYRKNNNLLYELDEFANATIDKEYMLTELVETLKKVLTQEEYYIVHKIYFMGFSEAELADQLNITENAVRMRMIKIKKKLVKNLCSFYIIVILILN